MGWNTALDGQGNTYYWNEAGESTYEKPADFNADTAQAAGSYAQYAQQSNGGGYNGGGYNGGGYGNDRGNHGTRDGGGYGDDRGNHGGGRGGYADDRGNYGGDTGGYGGDRSGYSSGERRPG